MSAVKLKGEALAKAFVALLEKEGIPEPTRELVFTPERKFRFDYSWPADAVALEVEGGVWVSGRHNRGSGFLKDIEKYNLATMHGWRVFRVTPDTLCADATITLLREALRVEKPRPPLRRNDSTPEGKAMWENIDRAAARVRKVAPR